MSHWRAPRRPYVEYSRHNAAFEAYYRGVLVEEEVWEEFLASCRSALPSNFSFLQCPAGADNLRARFVRLLEGLDAEFSTSGDRDGPDSYARTGFTVAAGCHVWTSVRPRSDVQPGGPPVCLKLGVEACTEHVRCAELPWFPNGYGWQLSAPRRELAMYSLLGRIRSFIQDARAAGRLNRQEAGSMLPPLLLDVRPGHAVLDMCAAPGSKTVLLLDLLRHRGGAAGNGGAAGGGGTAGKGGAAGGCGPVDGCVVANDGDTSRTRKMRVRLLTLRSPGLLLTSQPAQDFPGGGFLFDRVLADVPCTGDATMRKNPSTWQAWAGVRARGMHGVQLSILLRGLELLKPGGKLVYSTCSFSPLENEAVVAEALRRHGVCANSRGGVELLPARLPGLRVSPGLCTWRVPYAGHPAGILTLAEAEAGGGGAGAMSGAQKKRRAREAAAAEAREAGGAAEGWVGGGSAAEAAAGAAAGTATRVPPDCDAAWGGHAEGLQRMAIPAVGPATSPAHVAGPPAALRPPTRVSTVPASLFAPLAGEAAALHLDRCLRLLPHVQDTGGFFCALFRKRTADEMETQAGGVGGVEEVGRGKDEVGSGQDGAGGRAGDSRLATAWKTNRSQPPPAHSGARCVFTPTFPSSPAAARLAAFYGLGAAFPWSRLLIWQEEADGNSLGRRLYFVTPAAADALASVGGGGTGSSKAHGLSVLHAGLKVFERDASRGVGCEYRVSQDGVDALLPLLTRRVRRATPDAMAALLRARSLPLSLAPDERDASAGGAVVDHSAVEAEQSAAGPRELTPLLDSLARMPECGCVVIVCEGVGEGGAPARVAATVMRWTGEVAVFISEAERLLLLEDVAAMRSS